jgi:hypothetical protein
MFAVRDCVTKTDRKIAPSHPVGAFCVVVCPEQRQAKSSQLKCRSAAHLLTRDDARRIVATHRQAYAKPRGDSASARQLKQ